MKKSVIKKKKPIVKRKIKETNIPKIEKIIDLGDWFLRNGFKTNTEFDTNKTWYVKSFKSILGFFILKSGVCKEDFINISFTNSKGLTSNLESFSFTIDRLAKLNKLLEGLL